MHYLCHSSLASIAVSAGVSLPIIGAPLGHRDGATTQRYAYLNDDPLKAVCEAVSVKITGALNR